MRKFSKVLGDFMRVLQGKFQKKAVLCHEDFQEETHQVKRLALALALALFPPLVPFPPLPLEIIIQIVAFLNTQLVLKLCSGISKFWRIRDDLIYQNLMNENLKCEGRKGSYVTVRRMMNCMHMHGDQSIRLRLYYVSDLLFRAKRSGWQDVINFILINNCMHDSILDQFDERLPLHLVSKIKVRPREEIKAEQQVFFVPQNRLAFNSFIWYRYADYIDGTKFLFITDHLELIVTNNLTIEKATFVGGRLQLERQQDPS